MGKSYIKKKEKRWENYLVWILLSMSLILTTALDTTQIHKWFPTRDSVSVILLAIVFLAIVLFFCYRISQKKMREEEIIALVILAGFVVRLLYVSFANYTTEQNDVGRLSLDWGHLGYINYLCEHGALSPDSPINHFQFYQPPLHHILEAIWMKINQAFGCVDETRMGEHLQALPLFYSGMTLILFDKIVQKLKGSFATRVILLMILGGFPYLIILSGSLNNEALALVLLLLSIYYVLQWYEDQTLKNILKLAVAIGCGMMTKISVGIVAPAIAVLFLYIWIKNKKRWKEYLQQFIWFGVVCVPLGLWYPIRNLLKFKMSIVYAPLLSSNHGQYIGTKYSLLSRFVDFSAEQFAKPTISWLNTNPFTDHNIFITMTKFITCGESYDYPDYYKETRLLTGITYIQWVLLSLLVIGSFIGICIWCYRFRQSKVTLLLTGIAMSSFASFIMFGLKFPHVCSMNVRYVLPGILLLLIGSGLLVEQILEKKTMKIKQRIIKIGYFMGVLLLAFSYYTTFLHFFRG